METERNTILIIDDEADVARYLAAALTDQGYRTLVAGNAADGLRLLREGRPDLLCLDLVLPGQTGVSLYREIRESGEFPNLVIVLVTGINRADAERRLGFGAVLPPPDAFVEKPIDLPSLIRAVGDLLPTGGRT